VCFSVLIHICNQTYMYMRVCLSERVCVCACVCVCAFNSHADCTSVKSLSLKYNQS